MGVMDDVLSEINQEEQDKAGFLPQLAEGIVHTGTLGYRGEKAPADLPLSGKVGRFAGEMIGFAPALEVGGGTAGAVGLTGLAKELAVGALYGMAEKPESASATIVDRLKQGAKTAAGFGLGYGVLKGIGAAGRGIGKRVFGPDELDTLLAKGAEGKGPPKELALLEDQRFHMPDETRPFDMPDQSPFSKRLALPAPREIGTPEDLTRAMEMESSLNRETFGQTPPESPMQMEAARNLDQMAKAQKSAAFEGHVNSWSKDILHQVPPESDYLEEAGRLAVSGGDVGEAAAKMMGDSVKHRMGETPQTEEFLLDAMTPKFETRAALEDNIDNLVTKNELPIETVQAATKMKEPINFLMSRGVNFDDAAELVDNLVQRARLPFDEAKVAEEMAGSVAEKLRPGKIPEWDRIKKRSYSPDEVYDLFYNVPIKGPEAMKHGLIELRPATGDLHLTEKGYAFVRQYNPEGLSGVFPPNMDRKILGAIRGQGYSNISLSPEELKAAGLKMGSKRALQEGFIRPATKGGQEIPGQYQLESKGAGMLAGGKGANANVALKQFDMETGLRALPGDVEAIAEKTAERQRNELLFGDIWDQVKNLGKKC